MALISCLFILERDITRLSCNCASFGSVSRNTRRWKLTIALPEGRMPELEKRIIPSDLVARALFVKDAGTRWPRAKIARRVVSKWTSLPKTIVCRRTRETARANAQLIRRRFRQNRHFCRGAQRVSRVIVTYEAKCCLRS